MAMFTGDETGFCDGDGTTGCDAEYDPSCYATRRSHRQVAWRGFGTYREGCAFRKAWNAWECPGTFTPARLIVESMDADHTSRSLTPVSLCERRLLRPAERRVGSPARRCCAAGTRACSRLMTFHATVALNRSYDLAFTATNPQRLRLMMPFGGGVVGGGEEAWSRVVVGIFFSSSLKLEVYIKDRLVPKLEEGMSYDVLPSVSNRRSPCQPAHQPCHLRSAVPFRSSRCASRPLMMSAAPTRTPRGRTRSM